MPPHSGDSSTYMCVVVPVRIYGHKFRKISYPDSWSMSVTVLVLTPSSGSIFDDDFRPCGHGHQTRGRTLPDLSWTLRAGRSIYRQSSHYLPDDRFEWLSTSVLHNKVVVAVFPVAVSTALGLRRAMDARHLTSSASCILCTQSPRPCDTVVDHTGGKA